MRQATPLFVVLGGLALFFGTLIYISTFSNFYFEVAEFIGFHPDRHLMRNTALLLWFVGALNGLAVFSGLSCTIYLSVSENSIFVIEAAVVNLGMFVHYVVEAFLFGSTSKITTGVMLLLTVLMLHFVKNDTAQKQKVQ
jgi:hypothetical protein